MGGLNCGVCRADAGLQSKLRAEQLGDKQGCIAGTSAGSPPCPVAATERGVATVLSGHWRWHGRCQQPPRRSDAGDRPCLAPCPAGAVRASSIFPILSVGLLFFGGLCVAASEFYKSKHNVILSAGIFFVSAGRSCPAGSRVGWLFWCRSVGGHGGAGDGLWVLLGCRILEFMSCPVLVENSPWQGKNQQRLLTSVHCARQHFKHPPCSAPSSLRAGAAAQEELLEQSCPTGGAPGPRAGFGGLCPPSRPSSRSWDQTRAGTAPAAAGTRQQAEGLPQSYEENHSLERLFLLDYSFLCALFPNASTDYRMTMSLSQGTALFCVFLLPTKRQITLPPLAGRSC